MKTQIALVATLMGSSQLAEAAGFDKIDCKSKAARNLAWYAANEPVGKRMSLANQASVERKDDSCNGCKAWGEKWQASFDAKKTTLGLPSLNGLLRTGDTKTISVARASTALLAFVPGSPTIPIAGASGGQPGPTLTVARKAGWAELAVRVSYCVYKNDWNTEPVVPANAVPWEHMTPIAINTGSLAAGTKTPLQVTNKYIIEGTKSAGYEFDWTRPWTVVVYIQGTSDYSQIGQRDSLTVTLR